MEAYKVVQKPSMTIIGIDCRTSNLPEAGPQDIPKLWGRFYSEDIINKIPNKISNEVVALYCDYEGDYTKPYSLVIGCPVSSINTIPVGMVAKTIPEGSYAIFSAVGEYPASLIETWGTIWKQSDLERFYTGDFELYGDKFTSGSKAEVDVFIAIQNNPSLVEKHKIIDKNREKFAAIKALNLPTNQYAITGSGALGIRGIRIIGDIDIIVTSELWSILEKKYEVINENNIKKIVFPGGVVEAICGNSYCSEKKDSDFPSLNTRIANAEVIEGLPFESLEHVLYFKRKMGREKDLQDILAIEKYQKKIK